jgi:DNA-binding SARP family transcriptional activator/TolB-like protein
VEAAVEASVEMTVESDRADRTGAGGLHLRLLGPMTISREGAALALPASRKVRALIAYLTLAGKAVARRHLCELLWDVPDNPRAELRWCLSKIRGALDDSNRRRLETYGDAVKLDLTDCFVDVVQIARLTQAGVDKLATERLRALAALFAGDFLDGLEIDRSPQFNAWLMAQRRRLRASHTAVIEHIVRRLPPESDDAFEHMEKWLELAPLDGCTHQVLLEALARRGRIREGEEHLAAAALLLEAEGLDAAPIRDAWRNAKVRWTSVSRSAGAPQWAPHPESSSHNAEPAGQASRRASVAVMPFVDLADRKPTQGGLADGLVHDIITRLAKLRSLFVIAQGTVFALPERSIGLQDVGRMLNVDYVVRGWLQRRGKRITVTVELTETRGARIVWREVFDHDSQQALLVLDEIGDRIVTSIANEMETNERNRAILKPPSSLDAWEAYHRGLWHIYRFNRLDNEHAQRLFQMAVRLDPTFARAYACLSYTHFQNARHGWGEREEHIDRAFETASWGLMADDHDPAAHWAMGRALWLRTQHEQSLAELQTAVRLSPSFAHGHYALAFVHCQSGDPQAAIQSSDHSRRLSPFDPLLFAMLTLRAAALVRLGYFGEAADWAAKAAGAPNAHSHALAVAACCLALGDRAEESRTVVASIRKMRPQYRFDDLLSATQLGPGLEALLRRAAERVGIA